MKPKVFIPVLFVSSIMALCLVFYKKTLVIGMIGVGAIFFPEASQILRHYCFGNGDTLFVKSDYIRESPVVLKHVNAMGVGRKKRVVFQQREDWRLSYAINPFTIEKRRDKIIITQWIQFDKTNKDVTNLKIGPFSFPVYDNIVHTFECKPFMFYSEFRY